MRILIKLARAIYVVYIILKIELWCLCAALNLMADCKDRLVIMLQLLLRYNLIVLIILHFLCSLENGIHQCAFTNASQSHCQDNLFPENFLQINLNVLQLSVHQQKLIICLILLLC